MACTSTSMSPAPGIVIYRYVSQNIMAQVTRTCGEAKGESKHNMLVICT